jgi:hypothetical protein
VTDHKENIAARESILRSIREHLAASAPHDVVGAESVKERPELKLDTLQPNGDRPLVPVGIQDDAASSLIKVFGSSLETVGGHCIVAHSEAEVIEALNGIISSLEDSQLRGRRIVLSNSPLLDRLMAGIEVGVDEVSVDPRVEELFGYDVGISTAQAAIATVNARIPTTLSLTASAPTSLMVSGSIPVSRLAARCPD